MVGMIQLFAPATSFQHPNAQVLPLFLHPRRHTGIPASGLRSQAKTRALSKLPTCCTLLRLYSTIAKRSSLTRRATWTVGLRNSRAVALLPNSAHFAPGIDQQVRAEIMAACVCVCCSEMSRQCKSWPVHYEQLHCLAGIV